MKKSPFDTTEPYLQTPEFLGVQYLLKKRLHTFPLVCSVFSVDFGLSIVYCLVSLCLRLPLFIEEDPHKPGLGHRVIWILPLTTCSLGLIKI